MIVLSKLLPIFIYPLGLAIISIMASLVFCRRRKVLAYRGRMRFRLGR